jgi:5-methyltetrahydrofolate--homocysteine methyltransferase
MPEENSWNKVHDDDAGIIMSALLTTTMGSMKTTIDALKASGVKAKTIVGGAPLTESFAMEIDDDGYAAEAA